MAIGMPPIDPIRSVVFTAAILCGTRSGLVGHHGHVERDVAPLYPDGEPLALGDVARGPLEVGEGSHRLAVDLDDHVPPPDPGLSSGSSVFHVCDDHALRGTPVQLAREL